MTSARGRLIERIRAYFRQNDFVYGYFPQIVMEEKASEWWCLLWYCVRTLDHDLDTRRSSAESRRVIDEIPGDAFQRSLRTFLQETSGFVPQHLLDELYESTKLERSFSPEQPQSVASYLELIDKKAVIPARLCLLLNGLKEEARAVSQLATALGRSIQLLDDLLDLKVDLSHGRLFVTREELSLLGLSPGDLLGAVDRVARLRTKWVMAATWPAYRAAIELIDNNFSLAARSWVESVWKLICDRKAIPLDDSLLRSDNLFAHYMGTSTLPFDVFPANEYWRYKLLNRPIIAFLKNYKVFELRRARELYRELDEDIGPLLEAWPIAVPDWGASDDLPDDRRFVDLNDGFGIPDVRRGLPQILSSAIADKNAMAVEEIFRLGPVGGVLHILELACPFTRPACPTSFGPAASLQVTLSAILDAGLGIVSRFKGFDD